MSTSGGTIEVDVVTGTSALDEMRSEWDRAAEAAADPNVFLTWGWLRTWWRHFADAHRDAQLHVVTLRDGDGLVAAAPLFRCTVGHGPVRSRVLQQISYDAGDYGGILLARRPDEAVGLLTDHLDRLLRRDVDVAILSRLGSDSTFLHLIRQRLATTGRLGWSEVDLGDACPYADVRDGYDLRRHLKKHKVRQRMRRLSEKYEDVTFTYHSGPDLDAGLDALVDLHRRRWDGREDELQGLLAEPGQEAFLLDAIRALDEQGHLQLVTLAADGRTVAVDLDFELAGRVYMLKGAFDPEFGEFSPGQLLTYRIFEDGIARGVQEFDFLRGDHPYKRRWANDDRRLSTLTLTRPGPLGRLGGARYRAARALQTRLG